MNITDTASLNIRKNVVFAVLAFGINIALVFLSYRLVIHQGGLEALGLWSTLYAWTTMTRLGDVGMANASLRFIALCDVEKNGMRLKAYLETGLVTNAILYSLLGLIGYLVLEANLGKLVEARFLMEAHAVLIPMMIAFVLMNLVGVLLGSLQGLHFGYMNSIAGVAGNVYQIILVALLVPRLGVAGLAWAQVIQYGASLLVVWAIVRRKAHIDALLPFGFSKTAFREMLGFSLKAQVANIANGLFEPCSKLLVGHLGGLNALGTYELAYKTLWLPRTAIVSGATAMMPAMTAMARNDIRDVVTLYRRSTRLVTGLVVAAAIGATLASPLISIIWIGSFEARYTIFMSILAIGIAFNAWGATAYNLGLVSGNMKNNIAVNVSTLMLLAVLAVGTRTLHDSVFLSVASVSIALAAGGIAIRLLNEKNILGGVRTAI